MTWGPDATQPFLIGAAIFLALSAGALLLLRDVMARAGESGWSWLPENSKFKTYRMQRRLALVAPAVVCLGALILLLVAIL